MKKKKRGKEIKMEKRMKGWARQGAWDEKKRVEEEEGGRIRDGEERKKK